MPPPDFIGSTHLARGTGDFAQKEYDWLRPCETLIHVKDREGPLRRLREPVLRPSRTYPELPPGAAVVRDWQRQTGEARARASRIKIKGHRPKVFNTDIWPVGSQGPLWRPLSPGEKAHRNNANSAVQAATVFLQSGQVGLSRSQSVPGRRPRRSRRDAGIVEPTPGIEAWDSVSQAPSSPRSYGAPPLPGPPEQLALWEVMSAETATATNGPLAFQSQDDKDIARHLARNRRGWYDHTNGRFLG